MKATKETTKNFLQHIKHLELTKKKDPDRYNFISDVASDMTDIEISSFIENIALSIEKNKKKYNKTTCVESKKIFAKDLIELYTHACVRLPRFEVYAKASFDKYEATFQNALEYWKTEADSLNASLNNQTNTNKPDKVIKKLYNHIFKGNAFEVFEKYHRNKNLAENSKTELSLLYQLFSKDNLFVETVELKHYIKWLNKVYSYSLTELKKTDLKSRPNIQRTNYYKEIKKTTLK